MENCEELEVFKKCFKFQKQLLGNLNVVYNESSSMVIFWNKYQIFVCESINNFVNTPKIFIPEFLIYQFTASSNYLVCLDNKGCIQTTSLKFKSSPQKRFKSGFQTREEGIKHFALYQQDFILSLKLEADNYFLCLNRINSDFQLLKKVSLKLTSEQWPLPHLAQEKCLLSTYKLCEDYDFIKQMFNIESIWRDSYIVALTVDKLSVYCCLMSPRMNETEVTLVKLYASPSEICDIKIIESDNIYILIALTAGTVLRLNLNNNFRTPALVHLNIAIYKFIVLKDTLIYTDGNTLWKSEDTFSDDLKLSQYFVSHVKDFTKIGDQIICTTYSNLIYLFQMDHDSNFIETKTTAQYCAAEKLFNNSEYLYKLLDEVEKNNEIIKKVNEEGCYITALCLSNRQDIMDNFIKHSVTVYDNYEDVNNENREISLSDDMNEYFETDSYFFLIKLETASIQHAFNEILTILLGSLKVHITLTSENKLLKTTSIQMVEPLKRLDILVALATRKINTPEIVVNVEILSSIPGVLDKKQSVWTVLYRKSTMLTSEHFIKTNLIANKNVYLKNPTEKIDELILETASIQHGNLFDITYVPTSKWIVNEWALFLKLPRQHKELLMCEDYYKCIFSSRKTKFLIQQFTSDAFLEMKNNLCLEVAKNRVKLEVATDESLVSQLKITSGNIQMAFNIRNFFSKILYNNFRNYHPGKEFVSNNLYSSAEVVQKAIQKCISSRAELETFLSVARQFERGVVGALPL